MDTQDTAGAGPRLCDHGGDFVAAAAAVVVFQAKEAGMQGGRPPPPQGQHSGQWAWATPEGRGLLFLGMEAGAERPNGGQESKASANETVLPPPPSRGNTTCFCGWCLGGGGGGDGQTNVTVSLQQIWCVAG